MEKVCANYEKYNQLVFKDSQLDLGRKRKFCEVENTEEGRQSGASEANSKKKIMKRPKIVDSDEELN